MGVPEDRVLTLEPDACIVVIVDDLDLMQSLTLAEGRLEGEVR